MKKFKDLQTTILGDIGEKYINEFALAKGWKPYLPSIEQSNPVDSLCVRYNDDKKKYEFISIEVKTKASLKYLPSTGFDKNDFETYVNFPIKVCILFVD